MVASGALGQGVRSKTLLLNEIPKYGSKPAKYIEKTWNGYGFVSLKGVAQSYIKFDPASEGSGIELGNGITKRMDNKVSPKNLLIRGQIGWAGTDVPNDYDPMGKGIWRMLVVIDKQCNKSSMLVNDLLDGANTELLSARFRSVATEGRFVVLHDHNYTIPAQRKDKDGNALQSQIPIDLNIPISGYPIRYTVGSLNGSIGAIEDNNIYIIMAPDQHAGYHGANDSKMYGYDLKTRLFFTD